MIKIKDFLVAPRESLPLLNGWQRIWLIVTGLLLIVHILVIISSIPAISDVYPDTSLAQRNIAESDKWLTVNKDLCEEANLAFDAAVLKNNDYNLLGQNAINKEREVFIIKIEEANQRLYKIETSGGKYSQEWAKVNDQIQAFQGKLNKIVWVNRQFNYQTMVDADKRNAAIKCRANKDGRKAAIEELDNIKTQASDHINGFISTVMSSIISFFSLTFGLYFLGWSIGWVRRGFKSK